MDAELPASPAVRAYRFTWWATVWAAIWLPVTVAFVVGFLVVLGSLLLPLGPAGWLVFTGIGAWVAYTTAAYFAMFTPVCVGERGFSVRVLWWWTEVAWSNVVRLQYFAFPCHFVYVRRGRRFRRALWGPLAVMRDEPIALVVGLERRTELFWEIWRRASRAQGHRVPVEGALPPPDAAW